MKRTPWLATLPAQIRLVANTVTEAAVPLDLNQRADRFTGCGACKKCRTAIGDSPASLERVKLEPSGERVVLHS